MWHVCQLILAIARCDSEADWLSSIDVHTVYDVCVRGFRDMCRCGCRAARIHDSRNVYTGVARRQHRSKSYCVHWNQIEIRGTEFRGMYGPHPTRHFQQKTPSLSYLRLCER